MSVPPRSISINIFVFSLLAGVCMAGIPISAAAQDATAPQAVQSAPLVSAKEKRRRAELAREAFYKRAREEKTQRPTSPATDNAYITSGNAATGVLPMDDMPDQNVVPDGNEYIGPVATETGIDDHDAAMRAVAQQQLGMQQSDFETEAEPEMELPVSTQAPGHAKPTSAPLVIAPAPLEMEEASADEPAPVQAAEPSVSAEMPASEQPALVAAPQPEQKPVQQNAAVTSAAPSEASFADLSKLHSKPITGRWETPAGADMRKTLEIWSGEAGVGISWEAADQFAVRDTIVMEGTYEAAVALLLQQYDAQPARPVGNLHINPETGQRILVVESLTQ